MYIRNGLHVIILYNKVPHIYCETFLSVLLLDNFGATCFGLANLVINCIYILVFIGEYFGSTNILVFKLLIIIF